MHLLLVSTNKVNVEVRVILRSGLNEVSYVYFRRRVSDTLCDINCEVEVREKSLRGHFFMLILQGSC